ncbi:hypothetical protein KIN20_025534 [Parelaphostrongylus tenuis]|uniref:Uncharacterized protein n=1 Tax=Parelaphostrongylus tenuis TaxID=148309 RepID=A0AAD5NDD9_PARTN|nr:hypothetical protein KIN20_025534 [Parelaphostrongylus tenuis]
MDVIGTQSDAPHADYPKVCNIYGCKVCNIGMRGTDDEDEDVQPTPDPDSPTDEGNSEKFVHHQLAKSRN